MQPIIEVNNISKQYRLGTVGTGTMAHDVNRWWHRVRGKEDPYLKIGETNDRSTKAESEYVWSLRDISFTVMPGEVIGIIGRNGAGKSTLLKILSRITTPTTGSVRLRGRVASLLEVGTGMHPELTGRENIYLNGAILGMRKKEIDRKLEEIIDFAGVARYIDTPVKRYSSGMHVRLGFSVAAHLEPDILIVDEVLAVGDAEFQKKCLGKMKEVSSEYGRTILFVSHNMGAIANLCEKAILLNEGRVMDYSLVSDIIESYLKKNVENVTASYLNLNVNSGKSDIIDLKITDKNGDIKSVFGFEETIIIETQINIQERDIDSVFGIRIIDQYDRIVCTPEVQLKRLVNGQGIFKLKLEIPGGFLVPNQYSVNVAIHKINIEIIKLLETVVTFSIEETGSRNFQYTGKDYGCVVMPAKWELI